MAPKKFVLALDQGTTGTHVSILDSSLKIAGTAYQEFPQHFPKPGWVEHDLLDIWATSERCIAKALKNASLSGKAISAIGITNQRETCGLWTRDGKPLHRAIVWQDRRTSARCAELKEQGHQTRVREKTGLVLDPYFSATKAEWLLANVKNARKRAESGDLCFGTVDTWLVHRLTGGQAHVTDVSNASRTLLFNLNSMDWDKDLLDLFHVPRTMLPSVRTSSEVYGVTRKMRSLPDGIPVAGMAGDQQAALFGQACFHPGESKCTYGTGAFLLMNIGNKPIQSRAGLLTTVAWKLGDQTSYALEGSSFIAGAAVQWLRDGLKIIKKASDIEALARQVKETGELVFVPALSGLGAPHWRPEARGLFAGIDRSTTSAHLARAVLEGMALQIHDLVAAMKSDSTQQIPSLKVDGGATENGLLMQLQADILGTPVVRPKNIQTTSLGAAFLAGLGVGIWKNSDDIRKVWKADKTFSPKISADERAELLSKWKRAVAKA